MPVLFLGRMVKMDHPSEIQGLSQHRIYLDNLYHACVSSEDDKDRSCLQDSGLSKRLIYLDSPPCIQVLFLGRMDHTSEIERLSEPLRDCSSLRNL